MEKLLKRQETLCEHLAKYHFLFVKVKCKSAGFKRKGVCVKDQERQKKKEKKRNDSFEQLIDSQNNEVYNPDKYTVGK